VDEKGTEASAVTAVSIGTIGLTPKPVVVKVTHPFLFLLRDRSSNAILFIGRVVNPASVEKK
jgi:serine protease inhibitor